MLLDVISGVVKERIMCTRTHTPTWFYDKITSDDVVELICAEIPNVDKDLYEVMMDEQCIVYGSCSKLNPTSPRMVDQKSAK